MTDENKPARDQFTREFSTKSLLGIRGGAMDNGEYVYEKDRSIIL